MIVDRFAVEVDDVRARVGEGPGHVAVETNGHARCTGNAHPVDIELAGDDEVDLVPDAGQRQLEMRVAGEDGLA